MLVAIILLLTTAIAGAQQDYLEVSAQGKRLLNLAVAPPLAMTGGLRTDVTKEITDILRFDLSLAGPFTVTAPVAEPRSGIRIGEFDFQPWRAARTDILIKTGVSFVNNNYILEFRLYDIVKERELSAKRYVGSPQDLRKIVHTFSDEVMYIITGEKSPFTGKIAFVSTQTGNKEIYLMDYDGYNVQRLTRNSSINLNPEFSPNGKEIIFTSYKKGNPDLFRREIFSGQEARISSARGINITGTYSPEGNRIALTMSKDGNSEIYIISKEGKPLARLTNNDAIDVSPSWSPDGSNIVFVSDRLGKPQLFIMSSDGANLRRLTTAGSYNVSPRWSPKGDSIVYCRQYGNGFQIHIIKPDGSADTQITTEGNNEHPRWSPDGRFITFSSKRGGTEAVYVMRADGSGQTKVSRGKSADSHPTWSPRW